MPFLCRFCGLFFICCFCFSYLPSMAPQLPSSGDVTFSVCCLPLSLSSLFPFLRKIRHKRRLYRGYSTQLAHRRGAGGHSRCLESRFRGTSVGLSGCRFFSFSELSFICGSFVSPVPGAGVLLLFFISLHALRRSLSLTDPPLPPRSRLLFSWTIRFAFFSDLGSHDR